MSTIVRLWQYGTDEIHIHEYFQAHSEAFKESEYLNKTEDWFHWKFEQSPYGKAIIACAFEDNHLVGCAAFGIGFISQYGKRLKCALPYDLFVCPKIQGKFIFSKLLDLVKQEAINQGISLLYAFPNTNSLPWFIRKKYIKQNSENCYCLKIVNIVKVLLFFKDIKNVFKPNNSNFSDIKNFEIKGNLIEQVSNDETVYPIWTKDYIYWRFMKQPNSEYHFIDNEDVFSVVRVGYRGKIKECSIMYINPKNGSYSKKNIKFLLSILKKKINPDIISYPSTKSDPVCSMLGLTIRVPNHTNFAYLFLDRENPKQINIISPSINAHTY